jgi:methylmalonyl-CoA mutase N-terminal domain/subunit
VAQHQAERLRRLRADRSNDEVERRLGALRKSAAGSENLMPYLYEAVKAYATLGEICDALRQVFGVHDEAAIT